MKHALGNSCYSIALSVILTVFTMNWMINGDPMTSFLRPVLLGINGEAIGSVDVEFSNQQINLNVHLTRSLTCKQVITVLGIESFSIKDKQYAPTCSMISGSLIVITYSETVET